MINKQCLPFECLQVEIQGIIKNFAEVYQCDTDIIVSTIYAIVSIAVNKSIKLFDGKYTNYPSMWICHVAPSGSNKSAPVKMLFKPINELNEEAVMAYYEELRHTDKDDSNKPKPICKKLSLTDTTPEAIYKALSFMPQMVYRDEIKGMIDDFDRYNRSGIISNMLSIWDSTSFCIDRKTEDPTFIREPFLDILGGIQPGLLKSTFGNPQLMISGFNQRILFVYPDKVPVTYYSDMQLNEAIMPYWTDFVRKLMTLEPTTLTLSPEAKDYYCTYYNMLQDKKASADDYMQYVYSKLQIIILRWSIVTHLLWEKTFETYHKDTISGDEMLHSLQCMLYFESAAEKVYQEISGGMYQGYTKEQGLKILYNSYGGEVNLQKLADALGCSRQYVSKTVNKKGLSWQVAHFFEVMHWLSITYTRKDRNLATFATIMAGRSPPQESSATLP